jgi:uncharacterized protein YcbK (DUF882 family)
MERTSAFSRNTLHNKDIHQGFSGVREHEVMIGSNILFPSGETLTVVSGPTANGQQHFDPLHTGAPLLDSSGSHAEKYVSKNFQVKEFLVHNSASKFKNKYGYLPDRNHIRLDPQLVELLQKLRDGLEKPIIIISAYRNSFYNQILSGAADRSQHLIGRAADIQVRGITPFELAKRCLEIAACDIKGMGVYNTFVHVDVRDINSFSAWGHRKSEIKQYHKKLCTQAGSSTGSSRVSPAPISSGIDTPIDPVKAKEILKSMLAGNAEQDPNKLTDELFFMFRPERNRRPIDRGETEAIRDWNTLKNAVVVPALGGTGTAGGSQVRYLSKLGRLTVDTRVPALSRAIPEYQFTSDDALWLARFVQGEAGGRDDADNQAVIWAMFNRYGAFRHLVSWGSFGDFIRLYSTTLQPVLKSVGAAKRVWSNYNANPQKYPIVEGSGFYDGTSIKKVQYKKHIDLQKKTWDQFSVKVQNLVVGILNGQVPNPGIGMASDFASTKILYKGKFGRYPSQSEWLSFTQNHKAGKSTWIGDVPNINQMKNAFFLDNRLRNVSPGSIRVVV